MSISALNGTRQAELRVEQQQAWIYDRWFRSKIFQTYYVVKDTVFFPLLKENLQLISALSVSTEDLLTAGTTKLGQQLPEGFAVEVVFVHCVTEFVLESSIAFHGRSPFLKTTERLRFPLSLFIFFHTAAKP